MDAVTSPLQVRRRRNRVWAEDANGVVVVDGTRARVNWPDRWVGTGPGGAWKVAAEVVDANGRYLPVIGPAGREAARIVAKHSWALQLPTGLVEATSGGGLFKAYHCEIGEFTTAVAPYLAPQRYFTLTLTDAALNNPSRDAIAVAAMWISESILASKISAAAGD